MSINDMPDPALDTVKDRIGTEQDIARAGIALAANETVSRFGGANAEFIKGYAGLDNETGVRFAKGLADIAKHKVNADPLEGAKNIKQQAGYSAEVAAASRRNAEAVIQGSDIRTTRSDDLPQYGRNHNVVDLVQVRGGEIIEGSQVQMKFVGNRDQLFEDIAREDGKFSRYRGVGLELPSEQFAGAQDGKNAVEFCREKAGERRTAAQKAESAGRPDAAAKLRREADNYEQLANNVKDSGLTTEDVLFYRRHPKIATALDIGRTSHRAGQEGAKYGAIIGGCISLLKNALAVAQEKKNATQAVKDLAADTAQAGVLGYATAFTGAVIKGSMQQSANPAMRTLANTSAPTLALNICISLGASIKRYATGEISEAQLLNEVGEKGAGMLSSGMMAALGQLAIPIPFVGAAIGGMIGYSLSSLFYQSALDAAAGAENSRKNLERVRGIEAAARARIATEQDALDAFMRKEIPQLRAETRQLLAMTDGASAAGIDAFTAAVNQYATLLGKQLQIRSMAEFDDFMASDEPLKL